MFVVSNYYVRVGVSKTVPMRTSGVGKFAGNRLLCGWQVIMKGPRSKGREATAGIPCKPEI